MQFKGLDVRSLSELRNPTKKEGAKQRVLRLPDELWGGISMQASEAGTSACELVRAILENWLYINGDAEPLDVEGKIMDEKTYKTDMARAKYIRQCDEENAEFWGGYILGLHRAHDGERFQCAFDVLSTGNAPKCQGFQAGMRAFETGTPIESPTHG